MASHPSSPSRSPLRPTQPQPSSRPSEPAPVRFRCAACARALEFVNVPALSRNATLEESFVVLAPELALRARKSDASKSSSGAPSPVTLAATLRGRTTHEGGTMGESFVVLPSAEL